MSQQLPSGYVKACLRLIPSYRDGEVDFDLLAVGVEQWIEELQGCHAGRDGDCNWRLCPQEIGHRAFYQDWCPLDADAKGVCRECHGVGGHSGGIICSACGGTGKAPNAVEPGMGHGGSI